jgi:gamma-glutamylcyclotransferase (GGCT)/AIG2-like uncharacterized protein YtfP
MSSHGIHYLFVYGSLRSGFKSTAYEYISRFFNLVADAKVKGKLYDLGEYPAGLPADENSFIIGELYVIKNPHEFSWAIGQLDDYEGVTTEPGEAQLYRRELTDVLFNNNTQKAWIYWYNGNVAGKPAITSGDMMEYLQKK